MEPLETVSRLWWKCALVIIVCVLAAGTSGGIRPLAGWFPEIGIAEAAQSGTAGNRQGASVVFYSVTAEPAQVAEGDTVLVKAVFSAVSNSSADTLPVAYSYEVRSRDAVVYTSPTKTMSAENGAKSVLEIKFEAPYQKGAYRIVLNMKNKAGAAVRAGTDFSIVSTAEASAYAYRTGHAEEPPSSGSVSDDSLVGKWRFESSDTATDGTQLTISNQDGQLSVRMSRKNVRTLWARVKKTGNSLVIRSKSVSPTGGCWYVEEDVISLNARMDHLPVRSRILEGSPCVTPGRESTSTLARFK